MNAPTDKARKLLDKALLDARHNFWDPKNAKSSKTEGKGSRWERIVRTIFAGTTFVREI
jgi:hypothetical protein